jgi:hypothetical protein
MAFCQKKKKEEEWNEKSRPTDASLIPNSPHPQLIDALVERSRRVVVHVALRDGRIGLEWLESEWRLWWLVCGPDIPSRKGQNITFVGCIYYLDVFHMRLEKAGSVCRTCRRQNGVRQAVRVDESYNRDGWEKGGKLEASDGFQVLEGCWKE